MKRILNARLKHLSSINKEKTLKISEQGNVHLTEMDKIHLEGKRKLKVMGQIMEFLTKMGNNRNGKRKITHKGRTDRLWLLLRWELRRAGVSMSSKTNKGFQPK